MEIAFLARARAWARTVRRDVGALWIAARDPRVPWIAKAVAGLVVAYALSPIDLIPDFIPVLGYLDDIVLVPLGLMLAVRLIPDDLMAEFRERAEEAGSPRRSGLGLAIVAAIWIAAALVLFWLFGPTPARAVDQAACFLGFTSLA